MSPKDETLRSATTRWLEFRKKNLRENTFNKYKSDSLLVLDVLGDYGVKELMKNPKPLLDYLISLNVTKVTINHRLVSVKGTYDMLAIETITKKRKKRLRYPLYGVNITKFLGTKKTTYEVAPFSLKEIDKLLLKAGDMRNYYEVAFWTGLRTSELHGLKWEDIGSDEILIRRRLIDGKEDDPKTESSKRSVQITINGLPTRAKLALKRQKLLTSFNDYVFVNPVNQEPLTTDFTGKNFKILCRLAEVPFRNQYQIRHSYASNLLLDGANREWLAKQMGHKNTNMITRVYGKWIKGSDITLSGNYISQSS